MFFLRRSALCARGPAWVLAAIWLGASLATAQPPALPPHVEQPPPPAKKEPPKKKQAGEVSFFAPDFGPTQSRNETKRPPSTPSLVVMAKLRWGQSQTVDYGDGRKVTDSPLRMKFWADAASFPFKSHDLWFVTEDIRWGKLPADTDTKALVNAVNREDLWREAAKAIGQEAAIPKDTSRGVETFFDGVKFDPADPAAYLKSLKIKKA